MVTPHACILKLSLALVLGWMEVEGRAHVDGPSLPMLPVLVVGTVSFSHRHAVHGGYLFDKHPGLHAAFGWKIVETPPAP